MHDVEQTLFTTYEKEGVYHIQCSGLVPGPGHVYATLIVGESKALLVDNGFGEDRLAEYVSTITKLPIMAMVTHVHPDHMGGYAQFKELWLTQKELGSIKTVFPEAVYDEKNRMLDNTKLQILNCNEAIDLGNRKVHIICTPGHTSGSVSLYDEKTKLMLTGDTLSQRVFVFCAEPPIPLSTYKNSLQKLLEYDFSEFLAGHHPLPMPRDWTNKMIGMIDSFSPEKGRPYIREGMSASMRLYTVGKGFGDSDYCGFAYDENQIEVLLQ